MFMLPAKIELRIQQEQHLSPAETTEVPNNEKVLYREMLKTLQKDIKPL